MIEGIKIVAALFAITLVLSIPAGIGVALLRILEKRNNKKGDIFLHTYNERYSTSSSDDSYILWSSTYRNNI